MDHLRPLIEKSVEIGLDTGAQFFPRRLLIWASGCDDRIGDEV